MSNPQPVMAFRSQEHLHYHLLDFMRLGFSNEELRKNLARTNACTFDVEKAIDKARLEFSTSMRNSGIGNIFFGVLAVFVGLFLVFITLAAISGWVILWVGPIIFGVRLIYNGVQMLNLAGGQQSRAKILKEIQPTHTTGRKSDDY